MKIHCYCDNIVELDTKDTYLLDDNTMQKIVDGEFMSVTCDKCNKVIKPEVKLVFASSDGGQYIFVPDNERYSYFSMEDTSVISGQIIIGYQELIELVEILKNGFDQRVIEIIKLHMIQKVDDPSNAVIIFHKTSDDSLIFHVYGLKENEIGVVRIPMSLYSKIQNDLPALILKDPYKAIVEGPYISLRKHIESEAEE